MAMPGQDDVVPDMEDFLKAWMQAVRLADRNLVTQATNGHCDAFALALHDTLREGFPQMPVGLVVVARQRVALSDSTQVEESTPLSHVWVEVAGLSVDINGPDADERWEEDWVQPFERESRGWGENEDFEDIFDYQPISGPSLRVLRQAHSGKPVDAGCQARFRAALEASLAQVRPAQVRPRARRSGPA